MRMLRSISLLVGLGVGCTCGGSKPLPGGGPVDPVAVQSCAGLTEKLAALYGEEAAAAGASKERQEEAVRDNSAMVLAECARRPEVVRCAISATSAAELERKCLLPLPEDGSEAAALAP